MYWKFILPKLEEASNPTKPSIKYSLFPPLGLATLAGYIPRDHDVSIVDEHTETLTFDDNPDVILIEVYITNAYRAYEIADYYLSQNVTVVLGGIHVTSLPDEARNHASAIVTGPGDHIFKDVVYDIIHDNIKPLYRGKRRDLIGVPAVRRELIKLNRYLVPNSIVVSRGCPYSCSFCYKESFFKGGKSYYTYALDQAMKEIDSLYGKHLFFLDDNILAESKFSYDLFEELISRNRILQGAGTVKSIHNQKMISLAAKAGLKSLFIGFETINKENLEAANKGHNVLGNYEEAVHILHDHGIKINASFVFGMDEDTTDVFSRTVDWAVANGITTATFHIQTPYPGTALYNNLLKQKRMLTFDWNKYNTRNVVYKPMKMTTDELKQGYWESYRQFYSVRNIMKSSLQHEDAVKKLSNFLYSFGWKKMDPLWSLIIKLKKLQYSIPALEKVLEN